MPKLRITKLTRPQYSFSSIKPLNMYGSGQQTGISTPRSAANLRPLILTHGSLEYTLLIPTALHFNAQQLRDTFKQTLPEPTDELAQDDEPSSVVELVARYLGFIAKEVEEGEGGGEEG